MVEVSQNIYLHGSFKKNFQPGTVQSRSVLKRELVVAGLVRTIVWKVASRGWLKSLSFQSQSNTGSAMP